jgi:hypothetical protein
MALLLTCTCGAQFEVDEVWAGKTISCPDCRRPFTVPSLTKPVLPANLLALTSTVLALVGAFTLVGSVAAIALGVVALVHLRRLRDKESGTGFAVFGIATGVVGIAVTVLALRYPDTLGVGPYFRSSQWADKVDTGGELEFQHKDGESGFRITRPSHEWGVVRDYRQVNGVVEALLQQPPKVLFMQTTRFAFVDVAINQVNNTRPLSEHQENFLADLKRDRPADADRFDARPNQPSRITEVVFRNGHEGTTLRQGDTESLEFLLDLRCGDQPWSMLVRLCRTRAGQLYTVRGYAPHRTFDKVETELRKVMDTFRPIPRE